MRLTVVKTPALFSCLMVGVYGLLAFGLSSYAGLGVAGVALAGALSLTLNHAIFNPLYTALLLKISSWHFYKSFFPGCLWGCFNQFCSEGYCQLVYTAGAL